MLFSFSSEIMADLQEVGQVLGLRTTLNLALDTKTAIGRLGSWYFPIAGCVHHGGNAESHITVYLKNSGGRLRLRGKGPERRLVYIRNGRKWLAKVVAHEVCHQIDFQNPRWLGRALSGKGLEVVKKVPKQTAWQKLAAKVDKIRIWLEPLEIRARWHAFWHWRKYYRAIFGLTPFEKWLFSLKSLRTPSPAEISRTFAGMAFILDQREG